MKGDFSRIRFTPGQHFTSVLQQQGRVSLDADANEQCAIDEYLRGVQTIDTLGDVGGPRDDAGLELPSRILPPASTSPEAVITSTVCCARAQPRITWISVIS